MTNPIYPDKTKTGLAALKPLTDVFFESEESVKRWAWEQYSGFSDHWCSIDAADAVGLAETADNRVRLTPKPRRVWIGDQSYPEPLSHASDGDFVWMADVVIGGTYEIIFSHDSGRHSPAFHSGFLFRDEESAQQCLDAHRRARRVE